VGSHVGNPDMLGRVAMRNFYKRVVCSVYGGGGMGVRGLNW